MFSSLENFESWFDFTSAVGQAGADKEILAQEQRNKVGWSESVCVGGGGGGGIGSACAREVCGLRQQRTVPVERGQEQRNNCWRRRWGPGWVQERCGQLGSRVQHRQGCHFPHAGQLQACSGSFKPALRL